MENLKNMQECLIELAEHQIYCNTDKVDTKELGEVIDMIKDLSEATYYWTITESMNQQAQEETMYYNPYDREGSHRMMPTKRGGGHDVPVQDGGYGDRRWMMRRYDDGRVSWPVEHKDPKEGRSGERRKMYMDSKMYSDKNKQMQELENYMHELSMDVTDMIQDASAEEKAMLQQKLNTLAAKIK